MSEDIVLPDKLFQLLQTGTTAILATQGEDGYSNAVMTWAASNVSHQVRFGVDLGTSTLANLQREGKASLQIIGPNNVIFLIKGTVKTVKARLEALPPPHLMCIMTMSPTIIKDQSWVGVSVSPPVYQWTGDDAERMAEAEKTAIAEIRDWY